MEAVASGTGSINENTSEIGTFSSFWMIAAYKIARSHALRKLFVIFYLLLTNSLTNSTTEKMMVTNINNHFI